MNYSVLCDTEEERSRNRGSGKLVVTELRRYRIWEIDKCLFFERSAPLLELIPSIVLLQSPSELVTSFVIAMLILLFSTVD
jgi:hypothetical protein